jgi:hypothetical protein
VRSLVAGFVLAAVAVTAVGCGDDDDQFESYCKEVKAQQESLTEDLAGGTSTALIDALPVFEKLRDKSPDDLRDEWDTVTTRIGELVDALDDAGVDPATYDRKKPPAGLTPAQRKSIDDAAQALATPEMAAALDGVEQQARDVCRTPLSL